MDITLTMGSIEEKPDTVSNGSAMILASEKGFIQQNMEVPRERGIGV
jgi:hypothetical protein